MDKKSHEMDRYSVEEGKIPLFIQEILDKGRISIRDFFYIVDHYLDWSKNGNDDLVVKPLIDFLALYGDKMIFAFDDRMAQLLYDLDTRLIAEKAYKYKIYFSEDGFLYARCVAIVNGKPYYDAIKKLQCKLNANLEFESILYVPSIAWAQLHNKLENEYYNEHTTKVSFETYSNEEGWNSTSIKRKPGSTSYCVSYAVKINGRKFDLNLNPQPKMKSHLKSYDIGMKDDMDSFVKAIQNCTSTDEICSLIINEMNMENMIGEMEENNELFFGKLELLGEAELQGKNCEYEFKMLDLVTKFKNQFSKIKSIADIKSITIIEKFGGTGEAALDHIDEFIRRTIPEKLEWDQDSKVNSALKERFTRKAILKLKKHVLQKPYNFFEAEIRTIINLPSGTLNQQYAFEAEV